MNVSSDSTAYAKRSYKTVVERNNLGLVYGADVEAFEQVGSKAIKLSIRKKGFRQDHEVKAHRVKVHRLASLSEVWSETYIVAEALR